MTSIVRRGSIDRDVCEFCLCASDLRVTRGVRIDSSVCIRVFECGVARSYVSVRMLEFDCSRICVSYDSETFLRGVE